MSFVMPSQLSGHRYTRKVAATTDYTLALSSLTAIRFVDAAESGTEVVASVSPSWEIEATPPQGSALVPTDAAFAWGGVLHFARDGVLFRGFNAATGAATAVGAVADNGSITLNSAAPGPANSVQWFNLARDRSGALDVFDGVFRTPVAPLQAGQFQLTEGDRVANGNTAGQLSGDFTGLVDYTRGIVGWAVAGLGDAPGEGEPVRADQLTYNAVFLQYVPVDEALLGVGTARLPVDGRVPVYRAGKSVVVHHTLETALPNPVVPGTAYSLGRERIAHVSLRDAAGQRLPGALFDVDNNPGTVAIVPGADLSGFTQPLTAAHRVEDEVNVLRAELSGRLDLAAAITHAYPAGEAFVSGKLRLGDRFARVFGVTDRTTWEGSWSATLAVAQTLANYNAVDYPFEITNRGAITERWAAIFTSTTQVRVIGEGVGQVLTGVPITSDIQAINPQTNAPYFTIPAEGWGGGWAIGNVLLWETQAAGGPVWVTRAVLPGASAVVDDRAVIALRADVDRLPA